MATPFRPKKKELSSTYFVQERHQKQELTRIRLQDQMITTAMGGVLPEQSDPARFQSLLDIGCGSGEWLITVAQTYPALSLVGVDISPRMISYSRTQAVARAVADRVTFQVKDVLQALDFPNASFDLVNLRFGVSFVRTWDWPALLDDMWRVTVPGGVIRLTDNNILHQSTSPALKQLDEIAVCTLFRAGHLFTQTGTGLIDHLSELLTRHGCQQVQTRPYALEFLAGTPEGETYIQDMAQVFQTTRPFIQKWGCAPQDYDAIYQRALAEMQQDTFRVTWNHLTAWGIKP